MGGSFVSYLFALERMMMVEDGLIALSHGRWMRWIRLPAVSERGFVNTENNKEIII